MTAAKYKEARDKTVREIRAEWKSRVGTQKGQYRLSHAKVGMLLTALANAEDGYRRWHQAFLDAKYPDMLPHRVDLEKALKIMVAQAGVVPDFVARLVPQCTDSGEVERG